MSRQVVRDWVTALRVVAQGAGLAIAECRISRVAESGLGDGLSADLLRDAVGVTGAREAAAQVLPRPRSTTDWSDDARYLLDEVRADSPRWKMVLVAYAYTKALEDIGSVDRRHPNIAVADALGLTAKKVTRLVYLAREQGYLTESVGQGVVGGELTDQAHAYLNAVWDEVGPPQWSDGRPTFYAMEPPIGMALWFHRRLAEQLRTRAGTAGEEKQE